MQDENRFTIERASVAPASHLAPELHCALQMKDGLS
jgi:hypothetical protein